VRFAFAFLASIIAFANGVASGSEIKATPIPGLLDTAMITLSGTMEESDGSSFGPQLPSIRRRSSPSKAPEAVWARESTSALKFGCGTT
jgi:hypothetical protein